MRTLVTLLTSLDSRSSLFPLLQIMICSQLRVALNQARAITKDISLKKLLFAVIPFLTYLVIFSSYKGFRHFTHLDELSPPNYVILSTIEYRLFFCYPHKLLSSLANPVFDVLAAIPYLFHFPLPFLFGAYLAFTPKKRAALYPYVWCAGWVNLIAVTIQATFPTASPWFVDSAVLDEHGSIILEGPNEAGFHRLDKLFQITLFHNIYGHSPLKFGAFPSLHVAWPMVVLLNHPWFGKKVASIHVIWITLAALYSTHHYLIDAIAGILLVVMVRVCMIKIWSPFAELQESEYEEDKKELSKSHSPTSNGISNGTVINL